METTREEPTIKLSLFLFSFVRYEFHHAVWHWGENSLEGSEHHLNGVQQPMEVQLFHWNTKYSDYTTASQNPDGLSAVSFFYEVSSTDNPVIAGQLETLGNLNLTNGAALYRNHNNQIYFPEFEQPFPTTSLSHLLPDGGLEESDNYFHYKGSQTQPRVSMTSPGGNTSSSVTDTSTDCTESVTWIVFDKKIAISEAQLNVYRGILSINSVSNYDQTLNGTSWLGIPCCNCNNPATIESVAGSVTCRCCEDLVCSQNFRPLHPLNPTTGITRKLILYCCLIENLFSVI